jgi:hypothetical protein
MSQVRVTYVWLTPEKFTQVIRPAHETGWTYRCLCPDASLLREIASEASGREPATAHFPCKGLANWVQPMVRPCDMHRYVDLTSLATPFQN